MIYRMARDASRHAAPISDTYIFPLSLVYSVLFVRKMWEKSELDKGYIVEKERERHDEAKNAPIVR